MKIVKHEKTIQHPLEAEFDIQPFSTTVETTDIVPTKPVPAANYDAKDDEIEQKLEEIYTIAMGNVELVSEEMERVEGRYKARVGEVTAAMLNVALGAVKEKRMMKEHKDKLSAAPNGVPHTLNQNLIVADRNEVLRALFPERSEPAKEEHPVIDESDSN